MKALVTGGFGFIGGYIVNALTRDGWKSRILDIVGQNGSVIDVESNQIDYIIGSIVDYSVTSKAMEGIDTVIHLAAKHRFYGISKEEFYETNVKGTKNILDAMDQQGVKHIIFYSSVAVYGDQTLPTDEATDTNPTNIYGLTKLEGEKLVLDWASKSADRKALIIRPTVVFGPRNKGNMFRLIRQIDRHLYIPIGKGDNIKSIAYVENLVNATLFMMNKGIKGVQVYNYVDEPDYSFREILKMIYGGLGRPGPIVTLPLKPILTILWPLDLLGKITNKDFMIPTAIKKMNKSTHHKAAKIRNEGFKQTCSLEKGLERTIEWFNDYKKQKR